MFSFKSQLRFFSFVATLALLACGGAGSGGDGQTTGEKRIVRSLRIGQSDDADSRVAVSLAANTRESVVMLNTPDSNFAAVHVLYSSPDEDVARITVDSLGRPTSARTDDAVLTYSNYRDGLVDVTLSIGGSVFGSSTVSLPSDAAAQIGRVQRNSGKIPRRREDEATLQQLLRRAIIAVRTFGCSVDSPAFAGADVPTLFAVTAEACGSLLLDATQQVLTEGNVSNRLVTGLTDRRTCDFDTPNWVDTFFNAKDCVLGLGGELVGIVEDITPSIDTGVTDAPPPAPPTPPATDGNTDGNNDETPVTPSAFLGSWSANLSEQSTFTPCGTSQQATFSVQSDGDTTCSKTACKISGTYTGNFFFQSGSGSITGTVKVKSDGTGDVKMFGFTGSSDSNGHATATMSQGTSNQKIITGRYLTQLGCNGTLSGAKN